MKKIFLSLIAIMATMSINAQIVKVYVNGELSATYTNTASNTYKVIAEEAPTPVISHDYVEIGGVKWATMNLGATTVAGSPSTCYGDYYAWGETEPRYTSMTINSASSATFGGWKSGYSDGYNSVYPTYTGETLDASHDAATQNWGSAWRTPTKDDYVNLYKACGGTGSSYSKTLTIGTKATTAKGIYWCDDYDGVAGLLFSDGTNKVFFPAAGSCDTGFNSGGSNGRYWSSSLYTTNLACFLQFYSSQVNPSNVSRRYYGFTVRPVLDEEAKQVVKVYENGSVCATYTKSSTNKVKVVFEPVKVTGITISGETSVTVGSTITLSATVTPDNATYKTVTWSSSDETKAKVDQTGLVTGVAAGEVTITATANDGSGVSATVTFTVIAQTELCLAAGTRITMADGSTKQIEDVAEGDIIQTFDHEAGSLSSAKVCLAWKGESKVQPMNLTFASGKTLSVVGTHDFLFEDTRKYVRINKGNVASYIGKRFYNAETGSWDTLTGYAMGEPVDYYCLYTAKHLDCVAEGMLTCPDDVDFLLNIYELDENLKADPEQLSADKAKYGLLDVALDYPDYAQYKEQMEDLGCKYIYIAIGKGLVAKDYIEKMKSYWADK